ncbi:MAG: ATP-dependent RNA helicase supv3l1, mitochondrial, partial [Paramarteilia canceri]
KLGLHTIHIFSSNIEKNCIVTLDDTIGYLNDYLKPPKNIECALLLENIYDICDLYLWMAVRNSTYFPDVAECKKLRSKIDNYLMDFFSKHSKDEVKNTTFSISDYSQLKTKIIAEKEVASSLKKIKKLQQDESSVKKKLSKKKK